MGLVQFEDGKVIFFPYTPSTPAGYAFMALFAIITCVHVVHTVRFKHWFFIPLVLGGICETFGYYGRAWAGHLPDSPGPYMLQLMLILVSPVFISATIYSTLGKLKISVLQRPKRKCGVTTCFVLIDIVAFCSQIGGGLVQISGSLKLMRIGDDVVLGGLVFQLCALAVYLSLIFRFRYMARRKVNLDTITPKWQPIVWMLAAAVVTIWIRNFVRVIEFLQGFHGFISEHEAMLYLFDALLMFGVMILCIPFHYSDATRRQTQPGWESVQMKGKPRGFEDGSVVGIP